MPRTQTKPKTARRKPIVRQSTPALPEVMTLAEAATYLRVSAAEVLRLVREQGLPGQAVEEDWRFLKSAIQDWLRTARPSKQAFWETHFGALKDDPHLEEMLKEIYQRRGRPETEEP